MRNQNISDEFLNSFVDDELEPAERNELFDAIERDEALKARVCELRGLKEILQNAYLQPPAHISSLVKKQHPLPRYIQTFSACLLLLLFGGASGWAISANLGSKANYKTINLLQAKQSNDIARDPEKIIVQVSSANPVRLKTALDETENLLDNYSHANRSLKVEIIANAGGMDLLRSDVSPYGTRIGLMKKKYPNLDLVACNQTVSSLLRQGVSVHLLPNTRIATSAVDEINKRILQGWEYLKV